MKKYILLSLLLLTSLKANETPIDSLPALESVKTNIGADSSINESPEVTNRSSARSRGRLPRGYGQSPETQNNPRGDRPHNLRRTRNIQNNNQALVQANIESN